MDQPLRKPPGKREVLGQESEDDRTTVNSISSGDKKSRDSFLVNDGQLYDDSGMVGKTGTEGGSFYDTFGASAESEDGETTLFKDSKHAPEVAGAEETHTHGGKKPLEHEGHKASGDADGAAQAEASKRETDSPAPDRSRRRKGNSSASKGSCPSWLKTGLYKGGRSLEDSERLIEIQEEVLRNSPIGIAVIDNQGYIRLNNGAFMETIGFDAGEGVKDIEQIGARIKGVNVADRFWDAVEMGSDARIDEQVEIEGRGSFKFHAGFHPVTFSSGMSWCICYIDAVSDSAPTRGQLWEYQNYVACVATSSGDAIVGLDLEGIVKYWNQGAQALFGYTDDEIVGKPVIPMVPEELRREAQLVLKVVKEKGIYKNYDTCRLAKSGRRIPVTMTITAVRNDDGEVIGTAATLKDLRSTKDLHEKAMEAEKLNAVLQMAVTVYHKINNPLCVIAANTQLLLTRIQGAEGEEAKKLESILEATKRISTVLEDLGRLTGVEPQIGTPQGKKWSGDKT